MIIGVVEMAVDCCSGFSIIGIVEKALISPVNF